MISALLSIFTGGTSMIITFLVAFLPMVTVAEIVPAVPSGISEILTMLNLFVPLFDLTEIVMWWAFAVMFLNIWYVVKQMLDDAKEDVTH